MYYYVYVLRSLKDNNNYVGYTENLKRRMPLELIYFEGCLNQ